MAKIRENQVVKTMYEEIVSEILDTGLGWSTFRDNYPEAYNNLLYYRRDMEESVKKVLEKKKAERRNKETPPG